MDDRAQRLARGDDSALVELYDACADRVHHYLVVRLGSRADADDVLQETFTRVARARIRLARVNDLVSYVFATARNEVARLAARHAREGRMWRSASAEMLFDEGSSDDLGKRETAEWVAASLARLGDDMREVVELKIYGGLTFREISDVTGVAQGTVATRYRSALEKMRGQLAKELE
jgi:RNA polymerase sigma-70 factor (ECF subfamily)